jgi:hypothetical protein
MSTALKLPTFEDLYQELRSLPEGQTGEILNGELVLSPRPAFYHANFEAELLTELRYRLYLTQVELPAVAGAEAGV